MAVNIKLMKKALIGLVPGLQLESSVMMITAFTPRLHGAVTPIELRLVSDGIQTNQISTEMISGI